MDKTTADKLMYVPNNDSQKYSFCRFYRLQLVVERFNKVVKPMNKKKRNNKTFGTSVINSPISPSSLQGTPNLYKSYVGNNCC